MGGGGPAPRAEGRRPSSLRLLKCAAATRAHTKHIVADKKYSGFGQRIFNSCPRAGPATSGRAGSPGASSSSLDEPSGLGARPRHPIQSCQRRRGPWCLESSRRRRRQLMLALGLKAPSPGCIAWRGGDGAQVLRFMTRIPRTPKRFREASPCDEDRPGARQRSGRVAKDGEFGATVAPTGGAGRSDGSECRTRSRTTAMMIYRGDVRISLVYQGKAQCGPPLTTTAPTNGPRSVKRVTNSAV